MIEDDIKLIKRKIIILEKVLIMLAGDKVSYRMICPKCGSDDIMNNSNQSMDSYLCRHCGINAKKEFFILEI